MPNMRPLDWIERVSVGLTVLGLAGSIYTKQVVYATLPLGAYIPISYLKRQKIESTLENNRQELDKKNKEINAVLNTINKSLLGTASLDDFNTFNNKFFTISHDLARFKESQNKTNLESVQVNEKQDLRISEEIQRLVEIFNKKFINTETKVNTLRSDLIKLEEHQQPLIVDSQGLKETTQQNNLKIDSQESQLNNLVEESRINKERIEDIESQINLSNLVERLETLEIEIVTINSNLLSKVNLEDINQFQTNLSNLKDSVDEILLWRKRHNFNLSVKEGQFAQKLDDLETRQEKNDSNLSSESKLLRKIINELKNQRLQNRASIASLNNLKSYINSKIEGVTENLGQNISGLKSEIVSVQENIKDFNEHIKDVNEDIGIISENSEKQISELKSELESMDLKEILESLRHHFDYELIIGRNRSRCALREAIETAKAHLIIVSPWLTKSGVNDNFTKLLKEKLDENQNLRISIGWGNIRDLDHIRFNKDFDFNEENLLISTMNPKDKWKYEKLYIFKEIETEYHGRVSLKLLGTHEKYIVCDESFAIIGSHNFLASAWSNKLIDKELGIKIYSKVVIKSLKDNFNT